MGGLVLLLVDGVDHVYVPMEDAEAAFDVFATGLDLPVLWPFTSFGTFSSGGVSLGSIKLEIIEANETASWCVPHEPPQIQGVAFRPSMRVDEAYLAEVDARSIARTEPAFFERDGKPGWTNLYFTGLVSATAGAFVCDYHLAESRDLEWRRRVLADRAGGRLGVVDAAELVIGARDVAAARSRWHRLLDPLEPEAGDVWRPAVGPAISLREARDERFDRLVLAVHSVVEAQAEWSKRAEAQLPSFPLGFRGV